MGESPSKPKLSGVFDSSVSEPNEQFVAGLRRLKSELDYPLSFGDYLYVKLLDLSDRLENQIESGSKQQWIDSTLEELQCVKLLLRTHRPKSLARFISDPIV